MLDLILAPFRYFKKKREFNEAWKIIQEEFIQNNNTFEWLYKNEFDVKEKMFTKLDIVGAYEHLLGRTMEDQQNIILLDFEESLNERIKDYSLDLRSLIDLWVEIDVMEFNEEYKVPKGLYEYFRVNISAYNYFEYMNLKELCVKSLMQIYIPLTFISLLGTLAYFFSSIIDVKFVN